MTDAMTNQRAGKKTKAAIMHRRRSGFTLVELLIVIVLLGILGVYVGLSSNMSPELSVPSQTETLASNLRLLQTLANASGKPVGLHVGTGKYTTGECSGTDCASLTNTTDVPLEQGVVLTGPNLYFDTLGKPSSAAPASYILKFDNQTLGTVCVEALTGFVKTNVSSCP